MLSLQVRLLGMIAMVFFLSASGPAWAQAPAPVKAGLEDNSSQSMDKYCIEFDQAKYARYLRKQYGAGLRYITGCGVHRIEYGRPVDRGPDDPSGQWEFTMGSMF